MATNQISPGNLMSFLLATQTIQRSVVHPPPPPPPPLHHSITPSLYHSITHSFHHSLTHTLTHSITHSLTPSLPHSFPHSITPLLTHSLYPFIHSLHYSLIPSLHHSLIYSLSVLAVCHDCSTGSSACTNSMWTLFLLLHCVVCLVASIHEIDWAVHYGNHLEHSAYHTQP